jgi:NAD(P)H dehydrogenase (quinone)
MSVAISGAGGQLGRLTAEFLLKQIDPAEVVLLTRNPWELKDFTERGIEVRKASFKNPTGLKDALEGIERLLLISTNDLDKRLDGHRQALAVAEKVGVHHVIYTSIAQPSGDNPSFVVPDHSGTEQSLRASAMDWTILRNNAYAELQLEPAAAAIASGRLIDASGEGGIAYVSRVDCARAAATVLAAGIGHERTVYDITGPEAITAARYASLLSELAGKPIELDPRDDDAYFDHLFDFGVPQERADLLASFAEAGRKGFMGKVTTDYTELTGLSATPLADVLAAAGAELTT